MSKTTKTTTSKKAVPANAAEKKSESTGKTAAKAVEKASVKPTPEKVSAQDTEAYAAEKPSAEPRKAETALALESEKTKTSTKAKEGQVPSSVLIIPELKSEMIATCAYLMWEQEGYQHGKDREYWLRAEEKLAKEFAS